MPNPISKTSIFSKINVWIVGLTSTLVIMPSLINSGMDIYNIIIKTPKTEAEKINQKLFKENFGKQPVTSIPVPIKQNNGVVEVRFAIYEKGDVFVEFGNFSQWFPFPSQEKSTQGQNDLSFISTAYAQDQSQPKGVGRYQQVDKLINDTIVRERTYENGVIENQTIDPRSGDILKSSTQQTDKKQPITKDGNLQYQHKIQIIDLDQYQKNTKSTEEENKWKEALRNELSRCQEKIAFISRPLCKYKAINTWCEPASRLGKIKECEN